jgi:hypothetical protein
MYGPRQLAMRRVGFLQLAYASLMRRPLGRTTWLATAPCALTAVAHQFKTSTVKQEANQLVIPGHQIVPPCAA